uniref:Cytochrome P450 n=1 Tax=Moniliophthora roreri TaxID=221103 RepID=A0A0W0FW70_MONRR
MLFILFMLWYPEVLKKAREEVDRVVGSDRLPTFEDEEQLPYVMACIKELLRCRPPTPLEDTFYNGYFIPKGTLVFGNVWAMQMDPVRFPNPREFIPERWFTRSTYEKTSGSMKWANNGPDRDNYTFGWGQRFCQGMHLAEASMFITISRIIWGLDFECSAPPDPWDEKNHFGGFITNPLPFSAAFKARLPRHAEVIRRSYEDAQDQWEMLGLQRDFPFQFISPHIFGISGKAHSLSTEPLPPGRVLGELPGQAKYNDAGFATWSLTRLRISYCPTSTISVLFLLDYSAFNLPRPWIMISGYRTTWKPSENKSVWHHISVVLKA